VIVAGDATMFPLLQILYYESRFSHFSGISAMTAAGESRHCCND